LGGACSTHGSDESAYNILIGRPEGGHHSADLHIDGRIILKCILQK